MYRINSAAVYCCCKAAALCLRYAMKLREREREWAREADAERRKEDERRRELDAKFESKLREWERYERYVRCWPTERACGPADKGVMNH